MPDVLPLSDNARDENDIVAYALAEGAFTFDAFLKLKKRYFEQAKATDADYVAVYHPDSFHFCAALHAIWQADKVAIVPANNLADQVRAIAEYTDRWIGRDVPEQDHDAAQPAAAKPVPGQAVLMFTSGSTGKPAAVAKSFDQLNSEIRILDALWGRQLADALSVSSVSHQHMYGLPFHVLWPFCTGRPFLAEQISYLEQLQKLPTAALNLIASPAQLQHFPDADNLPALAERLVMIFSAGAALPADTVQRVIAQGACPVTEIYGSTETGIVATRQQPARMQWTALPAIKVRAHGERLQVQSPLLKSADWFDTDDRVDMDSSNAFTLLGRTDRVAKVMGKRISLDQVEACLNRHIWVDSCHVLSLVSRKSRLGAAICLTEQGQEMLIDRGRKAMISELKATLEDEIEKVAWPRYWRFMSRLPLTTQSKIDRAALTRLLVDQSETVEPEVLSQKQTHPCRLELVLRIPEHLAYFQGHFSGAPVLPGVVQVHWAVGFAQQNWGVSGVFKALKKLKFQQVIQPGDEVELNLDWNPDAQIMGFRYQRSERVHASGQVEFKAGSS